MYEEGRVGAEEEHDNLLQLVGAEVLGKSMRAMNSTRPLLMLVDQSLPPTVSFSLVLPPSCSFSPPFNLQAGDRAVASSWLVHQGNRARAGGGGSREEGVVVMRASS
eukprot:762102-Hanusia_phi.AAC.3